MSDPEHWISAQSGANLLERSAIESGRQDFSLLLAECRTFATLGPISLLLKHEVSLRRVIYRLGEFKRHVSGIFSMFLEEGADVSMLHWTVPPAYGQQVMQLTAAMGFRALTDAMSGTWTPERVHLPFARPDTPHTYSRFFATQVEFNSDVTAFSFPTSDLDLRNPSADEPLAHHAAALLRTIPTPPENIVDRTRHALLLLLPVGRGTLDKVAANLGVQSRALQRELNSNGISFAELLDEIRRGLARRYLANPDRSISEVAALIGYSSVSSFSRWFTEQFDVSPSQWQRREESMQRRNLQSH